MDAIYNLEKAIAQAMKSRVEMRNSVARYNPMTLEQWQSLAPNMPITAYVDAVGVRAEIWHIPVPKRILLVCAPIQASGVMASLP